MKNLYNEFFHVPKNGKVREKVLFAHITVTVISIIVCLVAMSITAYAYFSSTVASTLNRVKTANYTLAVSAVDGSSQPVTFSVDNNCYSAALNAGTYSFTLTPTGTAQHGFSVVEINGETYHTVQIENPFTFSITFEKYSVIEFIPHWGTSSHYEAYRNGQTDAYYIQGNITVTTIADSAPMAEPTPTLTPEITPEVTTEPTLTPDITPTPTISGATATPTVTPEVTPETTATPKNTQTPEVTPTLTPAPTATAEPTLTPSVEPTMTPDLTPTAEATATPDGEDPIV